MRNGPERSCDRASVIGNTVSIIEPDVAGALKDKPLLTNAFGPLYLLWRLHPPILLKYYSADMACACRYC